MQQYTPDGVRMESTNWRDHEISVRHRAWGVDCPATDLDLVLVEFNLGLPVAVVEYKHAKVPFPDVRHATYRALADLAQQRHRPIPFLIVRYWKPSWAFKVLPVNDAAKVVFGMEERLCERDYVKRLYDLRNAAVDETVLARLQTDLPGTAATP